MNNYDICHSFFYSSKRSCDYRYKAVSYYDNRFYSYYTLIGLDVIDKNNNRVLLVSYDNMSATTAKHIGNLKSACPYGYNSIIYVPFEYGNHYSYMSDIAIIEALIKRAMNNFIYIKDNKRLTQQQNRDSLNAYWNMINRLFNSFDIEDKELKKEVTKLVKKNQQLISDLQNNEKIKELKAKQRQKDKEKQLKLKKELEKITKHSTITDIAYKAYDYYSNVSSENKEKLRKILNPNNDYKLAYCWVDNGRVKTSKNCSVSIESAVILLKLWKHNKLKHGMTIEQYTVLEVLQDYVIIGCHKIPVANIEQLYKELVKNEEVA